MAHDFLYRDAVFFCGSGGEIAGCHGSNLSFGRLNPARTATFQSRNALSLRSHIVSAARPPRILSDAAGPYVRHDMHCALMPPSIRDHLISDEPQEGHRSTHSDALRKEYDPNAISNSSTGNTGHVTTHPPFCIRPLSPYRLR